MKCQKILPTVIFGMGLTLILSCTTVFATENMNLGEQNQNIENQSIDIYTEEEKNGWYQENGYWYYYEYDSYIVNELRELEDTNGNTGLYFFNDQGHMVTDQWIEYGNTYFFGSDGKAYTGKRLINDSYYLFDNNYSYLLSNASIAIDNVYYETNENGIIIYENHADENGWVQIRDKWGIIQNGDLLREEWYEYNDFWYYFDYQGLTTIGLNQIYDNSSGLSYYYYFDNNGRMMTNYWYDDGSRYYFGDNGRAYTGKHLIDDKQYLFSKYGYLEINYSGIMDKTYYITDNDGVITYEKEVNGNGWISVENKWAFVEEDGTLKQNEWYQEKGYWYYFDSDCLTSLGRNYIYDEKSDTYYYYHFDNNGRMITNQWIHDEYEDYYVYYYGSNGRGYIGKHQIDGKNYYFSENGYLLKNDTEYYDGIFYITDNNGVIVNEILVNSKGWIQVGDRWAYVDENNQLLRNEWYQEKGYWYYFDWNGLSRIGLLNLYNEEDMKDYYYYFDNNSRMVTNQWILAEYENWFYFGSDGKAFRGKQFVNDNYYLFGVDYPNLQCNYEGISNNVYYQTDENGVIIEEITIEGNGWISIHNRWMYINDDGSYKQNEWYQQKGYWYYFDWNGLTALGLNNIYNEKDDTWYYYYFDDNARMLTNQWIEEEYNYFYVDTNGRAYTGKHLINDKYYLFGIDYPNLQLYFEGILNNVYYKTNDDGVIIEEIAIVGDGWIKIHDRWMYVNGDGSYKQHEWYQENNVWYYFDWNGLTATGLTNIYDEETEKDDYYYFDKNGHMLTNQWVFESYDDTNINGNYYYVGANGKAYINGKYKINGVSYLFDEFNPILLTNYSGIINSTYYQTNSNGEVINEVILKSGWNKINNKYVFIKNGILLENTWYQENNIWYYFDWDGFASTGIQYIEDDNYESYCYYFDKNGHMLTNYWYLTNCYNGKSWMYFAENGRAVVGIQNINGTKYYFDENGETQPNTYMVNNGIYYVTDGIGKVISETKLKNNSWVLVEGKWYYFDEKYQPYTGLKTINGVTYYFLDNGEMVTGLYYIDEQIYSFGSNGHMIKNAWWQNVYSPTKEWLYFDSTGKGLSGWFGEYYLIDGLMSTGLENIDNQYYLFSSNGKLISNNPFVNEWNLVDGYYYYLEDNQIAESWKKIDNVWYYFDGYNRMVSNAIVNMEGNNGIYYFQSNGQYLKNSWKKYGGSYIYAQADGTLAEGWKKINNTWYYFDYVYMVDSNTFIGDEYHLFADNGAWLGQKNASGWTNFDNMWRYYSNGVYLTGWQKIDGKYYYFNEAGFAQKNEVMVIDNELFYFLDNCEMASNPGWQKTIYGKYVYLDSNHRVLTGWQKINNVWYYLNPEMCTGIVYIEGDYHQFSSNGSWLGKINPNNGWYKSDDKYYYFRNNALVTNEWIQSSSNLYYIGYNGEMQTGMFDLYYDNGYHFYFDNSGKLLTNQWFKIGDKWLYADDLGRVRTNVTLVIDNKKYSFDENGYMI